MKGRVTCLYHVQPTPPHLVLPASELDGTDVRAAYETARTEHKLKEKRHICKRKAYPWLIIFTLLVHDADV